MITILILKGLFFLIATMMVIVGMSFLIATQDLRIRFLRRQEYLNIGIKMVFAGLVIVAIMLNPFLF